MKIIKEATPNKPKLCIYGMPGCIDGEAEIRIRTNYYTGKGTGSIKLKNLHKHFNGEEYVGWHGYHNGEVLEARCLDEKTGYFEWTPIEDVYYSGIKETIEVKTTGYSVIATGNHKFWTPSGWKELKDIKVGDLVGVSTTAQVKTGKKQIRSKEVLVKYHPTATHKIVNGYEYCRLSLHRLAYEAHENGMTPEEYRDLLNHYDGRDIKVIPRGMEVHHINGDHYDNRPENLELLSKSDHGKVGSEQSILNLKSVQSVVFQEVISLTPMGERPTYDIKCVDPYHSFLANQFVVHNSGKSTLASQLDKPLFIDIEGGLNFLDVARTETIELYLDVVKLFIELHQKREEYLKEYRTIVVDSIDWLVRRVIEQASKTRYKDDQGVVHKNLEATLNKAGGGYGNGKQMLENEIRSRLIPALQLLNNDGFGICLIAHADRKDVMESDGTSIERIVPKIETNTMNLFVEWVDNLFYIRKEADGKRVLVLESDDVVLAKNRLGRTGEVDLSTTSINDVLKFGEK